MAYQIIAPCWKCASNGMVLGGFPEVQIDCPECGGTGIRTCYGISELEDDVQKCLRRLKKIMDKLEVNDD